MQCVAWQLRLLMPILALKPGAAWNIPNDLEQVFDKNAHRVAYISVEDGRTVTYGEVQRMANKFGVWYLMVE